MPILVRPVREQLEHDRIIRLLQAKWKKKFDIEANIGDERVGSVKVGQLTLFPDLILNSQGPPRQLQGLVEVETGESVNHLEAMAEWVHLSRAKAPFHLYVPMGNVDQARRLCADLQVGVAELWSYFFLNDQIRFALVHRDPALAEVPAPRQAARKTDGGPPRREPARVAEHRPARPRAAAARSSRAASARATAKASAPKRATAKPPVRAAKRHAQKATSRKASGGAARPAKAAAARSGRGHAAKTAARARSTATKSKTTAKRR